MSWYCSNCKKFVRVMRMGTYSRIEYAIYEENDEYLEEASDYEDGDTQDSEMDNFTLYCAECSRESVEWKDSIENKKPRKDYNE